MNPFKYFLLVNNECVLQKFGVQTRYKEKYVLEILQGRSIRMGQLIKLQDYVSRYEQNIYLYPSRYVRLKKQQWGKLLSSWESGNQVFEELPAQPALSDWYEEEKVPLSERAKGFFKFRKKESETIVETEEGTESISAEEDPFQFTPSFSVRPNSEEDLKRHFLDQLFSYQMKWASTTLTEKSFVDKKFFYDERLKYFLQRFPDTFLVLYNPIFLLKKAPVEVETILISPTDIWCISFLEKEESAVFVGSNERFWLKRNQQKEEKVLNPLISLNRTEKIIKNILQLYEIELPIHKLVLSRNGYIDYPAAPHGINLIERRNYDKWFQSMRLNRSPLKHVQIKAAQALLQYCQTTSIRRVEWDISTKQDNG